MHKINDDYEDTIETVFKNHHGEIVRKSLREIAKPNGRTPIWFCEITKEKQNETQKQVGVRQLAFAKWKRTFAEE